MAHGESDTTEQLSLSLFHFAHPKNVDIDKNISDLKECSASDRLLPVFCLEYWIMQSQHTAWY